MKRKNFVFFTAGLLAWFVLDAFQFLFGASSEAIAADAPAPSWPPTSFTAGEISKLLESDAPVPPGFVLPDKPKWLQGDTLKNKKTEKKKLKKRVDTLDFFLQKLDDVMKGLTEFKDRKKTVLFNVGDHFYEEDAGDDIPKGIVHSWHSLLIHRKTENHPEERLLFLKSKYGAGSSKFLYKRGFLIRGTALLPYAPVENLDGHGYNWQADYYMFDHQMLMNNIQVQGGRYTNQSYIDSMFNDREWQDFLRGSGE